MKSIKYAIPAVVVALALSGCGQGAADGQASGQSAEGASAAQSSAAEETSSAASGEQTNANQTFEAKSVDGAVIRFALTADGPRDIQSTARALGKGAVSFGTTDIDFRQGDGTDEVELQTVTLYDPDGTSYEFRDPADLALSSWSQDANIESDGADGLGAINKIVDVYGAANKAEVKERTQGYLVSTTSPQDLPDKVTRVSAKTVFATYDMTPKGDVTLPRPSVGGDSGAARSGGGPAASAPAKDSARGPAAGQKFTYDEALDAWQNQGMSYWDAFCVNYDPTTAGGVSQCDGIRQGTVDRQTGEYIGG